MTILLIIVGVILGLFAFNSVRMLMGLTPIQLFFLPDVVAGAFWLLNLIIQLFALFFSTGGLALLFGIAIVIGVIVDAFK